MCSLNTGLFDYVRYIYMGNYDYTKINVDMAVKDIFSKLPEHVNGMYICDFICASSYKILATKHNPLYGFILLLSYASDTPAYYRVNNGVFYKQIIAGNITEI